MWHREVEGSGGQPHAPQGQADLELTRLSGKVLAASLPWGSCGRRRHGGKEERLWEPPEGQRHGAFTLLTLCSGASGTPLHLCVPEQPHVPRGISKAFLPSSQGCCEDQGATRASKSAAETWCGPTVRTPVPCSPGSSFLGLSPREEVPRSPCPLSAVVSRPHLSLGSQPSPPS